MPVFGNRSAAFRDNGRIPVDLGVRDAINQQVLTTGNVFYVNSSTGSDGNAGTSPEQPFATLDWAIGMCTASNGDVILLMPGHAETLNAASDITADVAGVSIIGLGIGANRPTFSWSTTDSTFVVSAANVRISNIRCTATIDEVVTLFSVTAARVVFDKVDYFETASAQARQFLLTTNAADYLEVRNCYHYQVTAAGAAQSWIALVGIDGGIIEDNTFRLTLNNAAGSVTIHGSTACIGTVVRRNTIVQLGGTTQVSGILFADSSTGVFVHDNRVAVGSTALAGVVDVGNAGYAAENYALNTADRSGIIDPVADS